MTRPLILGIDVCFGQCAAALVADGKTLAKSAQPMERGHAEALPDIVRGILRESMTEPHELDAIAVTCGPGSFTGSRLGVAFARGMALAAQAQTIGISCFDAYASLAPPQGTALVAIDGRRNELFVQPFECGKPDAEPFAIPCEHEPLSELFERLRPKHVLGSALSLLEETLGEDVSIGSDKPPPDGADIARCAAAQLAAGTATPARTVYMRAPDAKPSAALS